MQSQESATLIDVQTTALFGNLRDLQVQMQNAVGQDATSVEELMQKVQVRPTLFTFSLDPRETFLLCLGCCCRSNVVSHCAE